MKTIKELIELQNVTEIVEISKIRLKLAESLVQSGIHHNNNKNYPDTMHSYMYSFNNDILYIDLCKEVVVIKWESYFTTIDLKSYIGSNKKEYIELENKVEELIKNFINSRS